MDTKEHRLREGVFLEKIMWPPCGSSSPRADKNIVMIAEARSSMAAKES